MAAHILDNPIWYALTNQHSLLAQGDHLARRYWPDIALFGAVRENDAESFDSLAQAVPPGEFVGLMGGYPSNEDTWKLIRNFSVIQMVYEGPVIASSDLQGPITSLSDADVPAMLQLVDLTNPGPFLPRTIELGGYIGIWQEGQLAAMAGKRIHVPGYHEISAVCTHPNFQKRGYARQLILQLIHDIQQADDTPFLNVVPENKGAIGLYERLGFKARVEIPLFVMKRQ